MANNLNAKEVTQNTAGNYIQHNTGLAQAIAAVSDNYEIAVTSADVDLTSGNDQTVGSNIYKALRSLRLTFNDTMTGNRNVVVPDNKKLYVLEHAAAGGFTITVKTAAGTGVDLVNGDVVLAHCDGTDVVLIGNLSGIGGALTDTDDLPEGATNKYFTDERAQDAVGTILDDGGDVDFTYDDATPKITGAVKSGAITEAKQTLADNTTANVSTSAHGYAPKVVAPSSGNRKILAIDNGETVLKNVDLFDATNPADLGSASPGTSLSVARRDHVHNSPGGSGGLILVEHKTITSGQTTVTFSGLDGDTDGVYLLTGALVNGFAGNTNFVLQPNNASTDLTEITLAGNGSSASSSNFSAWNIANAANGSYTRFTITLYARKVAHSVALPRYMIGQISGDTGGTFVLYSITGKWNESSTNLTSLVIVSDQTGGIGDGSEMWLYKYAQ